MTPLHRSSGRAHLALVAAVAAAVVLAAAPAVAQEPGPCGGPMDTMAPMLIIWPNTTMCQEYRKVCFDQETVVSYDPAYNPNNASAVPIPELGIDHIEYAWAGDPENGDQFHNPLFKYDNLTFRFATPLEASADLRRPEFSNCTVPIVIWSAWVHDFEEFLAHVVSRLWRAQVAGAISNSSTLVVGTPAGERGRPFVYNMLKAFTPYEITTFAEFSQRYPPANAPRVTAEGKRMRCFERAYLCSFGDAGDFVGMYGAMQQIYNYYKPQLPPPQVTWDGGVETFKVLIESRTGKIRNILNSHELVDECNRFTGWNLDPNLPVKRVQCRHTTFTGHNLQNVANVRGADMLVIVHGAACSNWLYMKEGSAMVEVRPYEFGSKNRFWADWFYPQISDRIRHKVLWFALNIEDPLLYKPTQREKDGVNEDQARYARDRHVILPFPAMQTMIERAILRNRSSETYLKLWPLQNHYTQLLPNGNLTLVYPPP